MLSVSFMTQALPVLVMTAIAFMAPKRVHGKSSTEPKPKAKAKSKGKGDQKDKKAALDHGAVKRLHGQITAAKRSKCPEAQKTGEEAKQQWDEASSDERHSILARFEEEKSIKFIPSFRTEMYQIESKKKTTWDDWLTECPQPLLFSLIKLVNTGLATLLFKEICLTFVLSVLITRSLSGSRSGRSCPQLCQMLSSPST